MSNSHTKEFRIHELPKSMRDEVRQHFRYHSVIMLIFDEDDSNVIPASGTLCNIGKRCGIVTARHVWDHKRSGIERFTRLKIPLRKGAYLIERKYLTVTYPSILRNKFGYDEPDIAFIQLPDIMRSDLEASNKIFYPLDKTLNENGNYLFEQTYGYWVTFGSPQALLDAGHHVSPSLIYGTSIPNKHYDENGWDYLELDVIAEDGKMPQNVSGMSGGGIWRTLFSTENFSIHHILFSGVNFFQTERSDKYKIIGHGPKSIYSGLLRLVNMG